MTSKDTAAPAPAPAPPTEPVPAGEPAASEPAPASAAEPATEPAAKPAAKPAPTAEPVGAAKTEASSGPCDNFRLDPAGSFGHCVCGHLKVAHEEAKQNNAEAALKALQSRNAGKDRAFEGRRASAGGEPCEQYRLDPAGRKFGDCVCGHNKAAHEETKQNNAEAALEALQSRNAGKDRTFEGRRASAGGEPCEQYRLDPAGKNFGDCVCGHARAAHEETKQNLAKAALERLRANNTQEEEFVHDGSQGACRKYVLDMAGANFGDCQCGHAKDAHRADAIPGSRAWKSRVHKENALKARQEEEDNQRAAAEAAAAAAAQPAQEDCASAAAVGAGEVEVEDTSASEPASEPLRQQHKGCCIIA